MAPRSAPFGGNWLAQRARCSAFRVMSHQDQPGFRASGGHGTSAEQHDVKTAAEVAEYLHPVRSVHDYAARDELPSVRIGRDRRRRYAE
jgi:hypothetical protein